MDQQTALRMLDELREYQGCSVANPGAADGNRSGDDRDEATCRGSLGVEPARGQVTGSQNYHRRFCGRYAIALTMTKNTFRVCSESAGPLTGIEGQKPSRGHLRRRTVICPGMFCL